MDNNSISDIEFNSILLETEQYYSLKSSWEIKQEAYLRLTSRPFKKQIKEEYQKEIRSLAFQKTLNRLNIILTKDMQIQLD